MGFFDALRGRREPVKPDLDAIFSLPAAAITLEASLGYRSTGVGSVAFRAPEGRAFATVQADVQALLDAGGGPAVEAAQDSFGFTWLVVRRAAPVDVPALVTDLHAINSSLQDSGFGPTLLCSLVGFVDDQGRNLAMVYLFKQGTFYPFVPAGNGTQTRDNMVELRVRDELRSDLPIEPELSRWFAVWGAPGLS